MTTQAQLEVGVVIALVIALVVLLVVWGSHLQRRKPKPVVEVEPSPYPMADAKKRLVEAAKDSPMGMWLPGDAHNTFARFVPFDGDGVVVEWVSVKVWPLAPGTSVTVRFLIVDRWDSNTCVRLAIVKAGIGGEVPIIYHADRTAPYSMNSKREASTADVLRWTHWAEHRCGRR